MDSHRQHEYMGNNEDRSRSIYCNAREVQDVVPQSPQYFMQDRTATVLDSRSKMCGCPIGMSDSSHCKGCNTSNTAEKSWNTPSQLHIDYRNMEGGKNSNKSTMYVNSDTGAGSYWSEKVSSFSEEHLMANKSMLVASPNIERRSYNKACITEQADYKLMPQLPVQQQLQPQQSPIRAYPNVSYCKERYYEDKYSFKDENHTLKMIYPTQSTVSSPSIGSCDSETNSGTTTTNVEALRRITHNNRIINPTSNKINTNNEHHHSPNYARKCTQLCSLEEQGTSYTNLYMPAPQFSSDKFTSVQTEKNFDFPTRANNTGSIRQRDEPLKLYENPLRTNVTALTSGYSSPNRFSPIVKEQMQPYMQHSPQLHPHTHTQQQQQLQSHASFLSIPAASASATVHFMPTQQSSTPKELNSMNAPLPSSTNLQLYDQYHCARNVFPTATQAKAVTELPVMEFGNKDEHPMETLVEAGTSRSGLYLNPYNITPMSSASCCKATSPLPPSVNSNVRHDSPHESTKYSKTFEKSKSIHKMGAINSEYNTVSVPATFMDNSTRNIRAQSYCYESAQPKCLKRPSYSPASSTISVAGGESPTPPIPQPQPPPQLQPHLSSITPSQFPLTSQQKTQHRQYSPQYMQSSYAQPYQDYEERQLSTMQLSGHKIPTNNVGGSNEAAYERLQLQQAQMQCYNTNRTSQTTTSTTNANFGLSTVVGSGVSSTATQAHLKKSQIPKPNYRELIKHVHAIRSAEDELNLQIIKKTMNVNVDACLNRTVLEQASLPTSNTQNWTRQSSTDLLKRQTNPMGTEHSTINNTMATQISEKTSSYSPLDLSLRTVKTKADSTDYRYQRLANSSQSINTSANYSYALPRVEFTPNFSLHTGLSQTKAIDESIRNNETTLTSEHLDSVYASDNVVATCRVAPLVKPKVASLPSSPACLKPVSSSLYYQTTSPLAYCGSSTTEMKTTKVHFEATSTFSKSKDVKFSSNNKISTKPLASDAAAAAAKQINRSTCLEMRQVRPSVLETNPYATTRAVVNEQITPLRTLPTINQLPPDTTIFPLVKVPLLQTADVKVNAERKLADPPLYITPLALKKDYSTTKYETPVSSTERTMGNLAFRKRNMQVEEIIINNTIPIKQPKIESATTTTTLYERNQFNQLAAPIEAIAATTNSMETKIKFSQTQTINDNAVSMAAEEPIACKTEPMSPTQNVQTPAYVAATSIKTDTSLLIAARIRTKAELKGFIFSPPIVKLNVTSPPPLPPPIAPSPQPPTEPTEPPTLCIKEEPNQNVCTATMPSMPELNDNYDQEKLLDFVWSDTCNSLVKQLLTNTKKPTLKKRAKPLNAEQSDDNIIKNLAVNDVNVKKAEILNTQRLTPLTDSIAAYRFDSQTTNVDSMNSTVQHEFNDGIPYSIVIQKKISKVGRDKLRVQQERRFAARLQEGSSSETDNELDRRKTERLKKPFKKVAKSRNCSKNAKNRFSDCGSDSTGTELTKLSKIKQAISSSSSSTSNSSATTSSSGSRETDNKKLEITKSREENKPSVDNIKQESNNKTNVITEIKSNQKEIVSKPCHDKDDIKLNFAVTVKLEKISYHGKEKPSSTKKIQNEREEQLVEDKEKMLLHAKPNLKKLKKTQQKISHNTITRSKRKHELELQMANSKVLRNDKIIRNSTNATDKIKRKYTRKFGNTLNQGGVVKKDTALSKDMQNQLIMTTRLRTRKEKTISNERKAQSKAKTANHQRATIKSDASKSNSNLTSTIQNDGAQTDIFMEVYRYKRSLKIPPSLITIKQPNGNNTISHKLSNVVITEESEKSEKATTTTTSEKERNKPKQLPTKLIELKKSKQPTAIEPVASTTTTAIEQQKQSSTPFEQPRSIIDVLHSRVLKSSAAAGSTPQTKKTKHAKAIVKKQNKSNIQTSQKLKNNVENGSSTTTTTAPLVMSAVTAAEMSSLKHENEIKDKNKNNVECKKRHFSIFDTKVLQTKTRTESKLQQKREIIREIFVGGEERPASAPPEMTPAIGGVIKMTYEQKYEQFLQQMNIVVNDSEFCRKLASRNSTNNINYERNNRQAQNNIEYNSFPNTATIKQEEDTESTSAIDVDIRGGATDNASNTSMAAITKHNFRRRKSGKYFRRKGSSGFDYIRKKKKPASVCSTASQQHLYTPHRAYMKSDADFKAKDKTEADVCREIQKWVLNKGVGQSTMHKAARLGYIDVIVYCLDRLCMNPDQKDNAGYTPLHEACTNGWLEIAKILLQYGAKHSETAHSGIRPLHEASENDQDEIVRLLLSYGADPLLATYSGQTPLMLASNTAVRNLLKDHLHDVQYVGSERKPWHFEGPWKIFDATECGYDVFSGAPPNNICDMSRALSRSFGTNLTLNKKHCNQYDGTNSKAVLDKCTDVLDNICNLNSIRLFNNDRTEVLVDGNSDSDGDGGIFEFEEADVLLPPLYLLKNEGTQKWVLLSDLCNLLKVKSKDTLLNKIYPSPSVSPAHKGFIRELKMSDFLENATCLQLLCAGEKINICASKVVLIKYNENVRNLLGIKTILMKF